MPILSRIRVADIRQLIETLEVTESFYPKVELDSDIILEVEKTTQTDGSTITTLVVKQ